MAPFNIAAVNGLPPIHPGSSADRVVIWGYELLFYLPHIPGVLRSEARYRCVCMAEFRGVYSGLRSLIRHVVGGNGRRQCNRAKVWLDRRFSQTDRQRYVTRYYMATKLSEDEDFLEDNRAPPEQEIEGQEPVEAAQVPVEAEQVPVEAAQVPVESAQEPVEPAPPTLFFPDIEPVHEEDLEPYTAFNALCAGRVITDNLRKLVNGSKMLCQHSHGISTDLEIWYRHLTHVQETMPTQLTTVTRSQTTFPSLEPICWEDPEPFTVFNAMLGRKVTTDNLVTMSNNFKTLDQEVRGLCGDIRTIYQYLTQVGATIPTGTQTLLPDQEPVYWEDCEPYSTFNTKSDVEFIIDGQVTTSNNLRRCVQSIRERRAVLRTMFKHRIQVGEPMTATTQNT
ncbi:hypothetical protein B0O80DRAFT_283089 [Mortierella sp. GBAus27b]|nr:hypothetical protein B0O80DRAFT_283089 [Mortierella sp. GBAus27b]